MYKIYNENFVYELCEQADEYDKLLEAYNKLNSKYIEQTWYIQKLRQKITRLNKALRKKAKGEQHEIRADKSFRI